SGRCRGRGELRRERLRRRSRDVGQGGRRRPRPPGGLRGHGRHLLLVRRAPPPLLQPVGERRQLRPARRGRLRRGGRGRAPGAGGGGGGGGGGGSSVALFTWNAHVIVARGTLRAGNGGNGGAGGEPGPGGPGGAGARGADSTPCDVGCTGSGINCVSAGLDAG